MTEGELRKSVTIDAPPEVVFRALTDEKELVQWMPQEAKMDAWVGGRYEFKYHWAERGIDSQVSGEIVELIPGKKLAYTWENAMHDNDGQQPPRERGSRPGVVSWTLEELPNGKTRVTLVQTGVDARFSQDSENGWIHFMGQLSLHCHR
jgi:uncharacterized protein YndB with AHSA1/START domain